jgi:hypothetical protein
MNSEPIAAREGERRPVTIPIISLWMPWANWVMLGWKTIETRLHRRFYSLAGKTIGIHASLRWDDGAIDAARPYLTEKQITQTLNFLRIGGAIIGTVYVPTVRELAAEDSARALIDCDAVKRHGLELMYRNPIEAIPCRGKQGIWYADVPQSAIVAEDVAHG